MTPTKKTSLDFGLSKLDADSRGQTQIKSTIKDVLICVSLRLSAS